MNILKKIYCRIFQTCFRIALPVLPYREPELIDGFKHVPEVPKKHHISHILLVTDPGVYKLQARHSHKHHSMFRKCFAL